MPSPKETVEKLLSAADIRINGSRPFDVQVHNERLYQRMLTQGELGAGESYMDGWWSAKRLDETITRLLGINIREKLPLSLPLLRNYLVGGLSNRQKLGRAYQNAEAHYNIGNDLYERMLDKRMIYSCGFWQKAKNLDEAQEAKLDRICRKLYLKKGMALLDIGCGWGGFAEFAARYYGVRVTGISPAEEQVKLARERTQGLDVNILRQDYREVEGHFDRIVSIGMIEHVGAKNYRTFFEKCHEILNNDGIMLHHMIGSLRSVRAASPWTSKYIFPNGVIPSLTQIARATERQLIIEDLENFGPYYDKTLMAWHTNFVKRYPEIKNRYNERFYRMWEYYLLSSAAGFRARRLQLWQIVMRKIRPAQAYSGYR